MSSYISDPAEIYRRSFAAIREEAQLDHLPAGIAEVAVRLIHACGMPDIAGDLAWGGDLCGAARAALKAGSVILADGEMTRHGIIQRCLPAANDIVAIVGSARVADLAARSGTTRSAAAVDLWRPYLAGAVVAIGNAPTALFRLLELLADGADRPAAILAFPVGFVGAAESKETLIAEPFGVPYLTLRGRRGGSALAAAAVNALAGEGP